MNYLEIIPQSIETLGILVASGVAIWGINGWRREARWKRKYELAEEVLSLFYEAKDNLMYIRNPSAYVNEGKSRKPGKDETPEQKRALDNAYVFFERYEKVSEGFHRLRSLRYRFMTLFEKEEAKPIDDLNKLLNRILGAARRLGQDYWQRYYDWERLPEQAERDFKKQEELETLIWHDEGEGDKVENEVDDIISRIEKITKPIIKRQR